MGILHELSGEIGMARIVVKNDKSPKKVTDAFICMCGLSKNQPFCDASHKQTEDEKEETYLYTENGRTVVSEIVVGRKACGCHCEENDSCCEKESSCCSHK